MNDRDYLRSLGFTVGERGRFSKDMLAALADRNHDTESEELHKELDELEIDASVIREPLREARVLHGFDNEGHNIAFVLCSECHQHMIWCECEGGVKAPSYVVKSDDALVRLA